ncbi:MAG: TRAP transporter large permease subunit, partial [Deinococcus-Thermus bacterium]|nr:TRAP transporter large permease subunit [Deinococcota bacterium]
MSDPAIGMAGFGVVLALILMRIPVGVAMALVGAGGYWLLNGWRGTEFVLGTAPFESVFPYSLSVVPLFILMGLFVNKGGISRELYAVSNAFLGHMRGGLAM